MRVQVRLSRLILSAVVVVWSLTTSLAIANSEGSTADDGEKVAFREEKRTSYALIDAIPNPCKATLRVDDKSMTCVRPEPNASFVCDVGALEECKAQCDKGIGRSCWQAAANRTGRWNDNAGTSGREEAFPWLEKGCAAGYAPACTLVAYAIHSGSGTKVNKERGKALMQEACEMGDAPACTMIAGNLRHGSAGFVRDRERALNFYEKACIAGATSACLDGANLLNGKATNLKRDAAREAALLETGCKAGDSGACSRKERRERQAPKANAKKSKAERKS